MSFLCPLLASLFAAELSPCGNVKLDSAPKSAIVQDANWAEMIEISGRNVKVWATAGALPGRNVFLWRVPGWSPTNRVHFADGFGSMGSAGFHYDSELFYALKPDVIHIDPVQLAGNRAWNGSKIADIRRNVAPFFANRFSRDDVAPKGCVDYKFYTIGELAMKMGELYGCKDRMAAIVDFVRETERSVTNRLSNVKSPKVALVMANDKGAVLPFRMRGGIGQAQYRLLGVKDAFDGIEARDYATKGPGMNGDLELLIIANPDVIISPFSGSVPESHSQYQQFLALERLSHKEAAKNITAFRNRRVYPGGTPLQGPVTYLFQLEMAAKQIYPEVFGEYRADGKYDDAECVFSRKTLADLLK